MLSSVVDESANRHRVHVFVYVHGLAGKLDVRGCSRCLSDRLIGNSFDLRLLKNQICIMFPHSEHLLSRANEGNTLCSIDVRPLFLVGCGC